jgi:hypothetical protein
MNAGAAASIHARLLTLAKSRGEDFNLTLNRYALERFLYRLSVSPAREHYWLKGALLFDLWFDVPHLSPRLGHARSDLLLGHAARGRRSGVGDRIDRGGGA